MSDSPQLPGSHSKPLDDRTGMWRAEWFKFFRDLAAMPQITVDQSAAILALAERVTTLEEATQALGSILGLGSVSVVGTLGDQVVIQLEGDEENPAASYYYGTGADGTKGFHAMPDPPPQVFNRIDTSGDIRVTTDGALRITD